MTFFIVQLQQKYWLNSNEIFKITLKLIKFNIFDIFLVFFFALLLLKIAKEQGKYDENY
jgi:hypothetical protein